MQNCCFFIFHYTFYMLYDAIQNYIYSVFLKSCVNQSKFYVVHLKKYLYILLSITFMFPYLTFSRTQFINPFSSN